MKAIGYGVMSIISIVAIFAMFGYMVVQIDKWERANGFPFGKLCQLYNTCR